MKENKRGRAGGKVERGALLAGLLGGGGLVVLVLLVGLEAALEVLVVLVVGEISEAAELQVAKGISDGWADVMRTRMYSRPQGPW